MYGLVHGSLEAENVTDATDNKTGNYMTEMGHFCYGWAREQTYVERSIVLVELLNVSVSGNDGLITDTNHRVWATIHDDQVRCCEGTCGWGGGWGGGLLCTGVEGGSHPR